MMQQNTSLFMEYVGEKAWLANLGENPELICISGPYINQRIVKEVYGDLPKDETVLHATPTTHHDAHWDHPGRHSRISPSEVKKALNSNGEVKGDCIFTMQADLRMREEKDGFLISQNNTAYFVNNKGAHLLKLFGNGVQVSDVRMLCEREGVPNEAGMEFLKKLILFGLYKPV